MPGLAPLLLATPLFGLALHPPDMAPLLDLDVGHLPPSALVAMLDEGDEEGEGGSVGDDEAESDEGSEA